MSTVDARPRQRWQYGAGAELLQIVVGFAGQRLRHGALASHAAVGGRDKDGGLRVRSADTGPEYWTAC